MIYIYEENRITELISGLIEFCSKYVKSGNGQYSKEVTKVSPIENYKNDFRTVQQYQIVIERLEVLEKFMNKFDLSALQASHKERSIMATHQESD